MRFIGMQPGSRQGLPQAARTHALVPTCVLGLEDRGTVRMTAAQERRQLRPSAGCLLGIGGSAPVRQCRDLAERIWYSAISFSPIVLMRARARLIKAWATSSPLQPTASASRESS